MRRKEVRNLRQAAHTLSGPPALKIWEDAKASKNPLVKERGLAS